jgi:hypothetical protein
MAKVRLDFNFPSRLLLAALQQYPKEVESHLRPAVRAGALVLYNEMKRVVPVSKKPRRRGRKTYVPGTLKNSIYHAFSADNSGPGKVSFHVGPNMKKAPHWWLVENGHWLVRGNKKFGPQRRVQWVPGKPYIRPTWDSKGDEAVTKVLTTLRERLRARRVRGRAAA